MSILEGKRVLLTGASGFIGTNLVDLLVASGAASVMNVDLQPPLRTAQRRYWQYGDVTDRRKLSLVASKLDPHFFVHLAARTDTASSGVATYAVNYVGTRNAVAAADVPALERFVLISTQFVLGPESPFMGETEYAPHTAYGESKAIAEQLLRDQPPAVTWSILRPTNVWGPWHLRYQRQFWRVVKSGLYLHPSAPDPIRSYGYVGSVCLQILAALTVPTHRVHERVLYVGDDPVTLSTWVDAFSIALRNRPARRVPSTLVAALGRIGDCAAHLGLPSPLTTSRFRSMTEDYPTPMDRTWRALESCPTIPLNQGVAETVDWLRNGRTAPVATWLSR